MVLSSVDFAGLFLVDILALAVCILASVEVHSISGSLVRGDPDMSHGLQIRRWFMGAIAGASGSRALCTTGEIFYQYLCGVLTTAPSGTLLATLRVLPTLPYYTMYTLLTVYLAQLVFTVNGALLQLLSLSLAWAVFTWLFSLIPIRLLYTNTLSSLILILIPPHQPPPTVYTIIINTIYRHPFLPRAQRVVLRQLHPLPPRHLLPIPRPTPSLSLQHTATRLPRRSVGIHLVWQSGIQIYAFAALCCCRVGGSVLQGSARRLHWQYINSWQQ